MKEMFRFEIYFGGGVSQQDSVSDLTNWRGCRAALGDGSIEEQV